MKIIIVVTVMLTGVSIKAMSLAELNKEFGIHPRINVVDIERWEESLNEFITNRDREIADIQNKDLKNMQSLRDILLSQAVELVELAKQVRQIAIVHLNAPWELYGQEFEIAKAINDLIAQLEPQVKPFMKEFKPIPQDWSTEIIEVKMLAAMVDKQLDRLKYVTRSKLSSVQNALDKSRGPAIEYLTTKITMLQVIEEHIRAMGDAVYSPKKINESIQKFAEYLLTLSADKLPKIDHKTLSELEAPYRSYASILRGYLWGS